MTEMEIGQELSKKCEKFKEYYDKSVKDAFASNYQGYFTILLDAIVNLAYDLEESEKDDEVTYNDYLNIKKCFEESETEKNMWQQKYFELLEHEATSLTLSSGKIFISIDRLPEDMKKKFQESEEES